MKNLLAGLLLIFGLAARAQTFTPIHNYQQPDGLSLYKYFGVPYGPTPILNVTRTVPGAVFYNTTDSSLYSWTGVQWLRATGGVVISPSPGVDSITISGNVICQWRAGVSTCYALDRFFTDVALSADRLRYIYYNFMGDSLKTVDIPHTYAEQGAGMILTRRGDTVNFASSGTGGTVPKFTPQAVPFAQADSTLGEDPQGLFYNGTNLSVGHNNPSAPSGISVNFGRGLVLADIGGLYISAGGNGTIGTPDPTKHIQLQNNGNKLVDIYADGNTMVGLHTNIKTDVLLDSLKTTGTAPASAGTDRMVTTDINGKLSFAAIPTPGSSVSLTAGLGMAASPSTITGSGSFALDSASAVVLSRARAAATYQPLITGTGFVKSTAGTITYDNSTYQTSNQAVTVTATGDATGTSSASGTAPSIPLVLATVNSNVGSFTNASVTVNAKGLVTAVSSGAAGGTPGLTAVTAIDSATTHFTSFNAGQSVGASYSTLGDIINNNLASLPSGWGNTHPNNTNSFTGTKFTNSGTSNNWNNYLETDFYNYDKVRVRTTFVPKTKAANDAIGYTFAGNALNFSTSFRVSLNLSNSSDSGRLVMNYDGGTTVAYSAPFSIAIGDSSEFDLVREGWTVTAYVLNKTKGKRTELSFTSALGFGTGGKLRLTFINGDQDVTNFYATSWSRKNADFLVLGDSHAAGTGASTQWNSYAYQTFNSTTRFNDMSNPSLTMDKALLSHLPNILTLTPRNVIIALGYNDRRDLSSDTTTFRQRLDSLAAPLIRNGIGVVFMNLVPTTTAAVQSFDTTIRNLSVTRSSQLIDIRSQLGGSTMSQNYLSSDAVHLSDSGHTVVANRLKQSISNLQNGFEKDTSSTHLEYDLPVGKPLMSMMVVDAKNNVYKYPVPQYNGLLNSYNSNGMGSRAQANSELHVSSYVISDSALLSRSTNGLNIGFSKYTYTTSVTYPGIGENINITGATTPGSIGQAFDNMSGRGNIDIVAPSANKVANALTSTISGNNNLILNSTKGATLSGSNNTLLTAYSSGITTGSNNIGIGSDALKGISTGGQNIHFITRNSSAATFANISDGMIFGDASSAIGDAYVAGDVAFAPYLFGAPTNMWLGGRVAGGTLAIGLSVAANAGTNQQGLILTESLSRGTGLSESGKKIVRVTIPTTTGSSLQSSYVNLEQQERTGTLFASTASTLTKASDAVLEAQSTTQGFLPPRMTSAQRDLISTGVLTMAVSAGGTLYTNGNVGLSFSGGGGTGAVGYVVIAGGVVQSVTLTARGSGYTSAPTATLTSGPGTGATFTITIGATLGSTIYCTDCTATNGHTGVTQTYNGPTNGWENYY